MSDQEVDTVAPESFEELLSLLQEHFDSLSPSHKRLAERVMIDPEAIAFMTVSDVGRTVGVNEATVVRFARAMGLRGFPALVELCRQQLRKQAQLLRRFENLEQLDNDSRANAVALDQANITRTFARIVEADWDRAVSCLADAPRVHVMGLRKTHAPAYLLGYLLGMLREDVALITGGVGGLADELRRVRPGDCFVAISIHRYVMDTVRGAQWARERGAHVIALTDNPSSPLVSSAHEAFYLDVSSASVLRSMTAFTSVVQALSADVAQRQGHSAREHLLAEEALLSGLDVYTADVSE